MENNRFLFSDKEVEGLPAAAKARDYFYDTDEKGLGLAVTPRGTKSFFYHGRVHGRPERIMVGTTDDTTVDEARARVLLVRAAIIRGEDPRLAVRAARRKRGSGALSLGDFWSLYLDEYGKGKLTNWKAHDREFDLYFSDLAHLPVDSITPDQVRAWHRRLGRDSGGPTANKMVNRLRAIYNKAMLWKRIDGQPFSQMNPAAAQLVERFEEEERDRFLQDHELPRFLEALANFESPAGRHYFTLALFTAARKNSLKRMKFSDINMETAVWTIPKEDTKKTKGRRRSHAIPLTQQALKIIQIRKAMLVTDWVFPGRRSNGKPLANVDFWWNQLREAHGIKDLTIHDLRRTMASWMGMTGAPVHTIAHYLGHSLPGVTHTYARLALESVRQSAQAAENKILEVGNVAQDQ